MDAVIFDLGGTLVSYYRRDEFPPILRSSISNVARVLVDDDLPVPSGSVIAERTAAENHEASDHRVRPLERRLERIFDLADGDLAGPVCDSACRAFLEPIFAVGRRYDDVLPALEDIRSTGVKIGLLSNTPWGSPSEPWREEVARHELADWFDTLSFCRDTGWRKPAREPFLAASEALGVAPERCIFVGDDPRWDRVGPIEVGMLPLTLDRDGTTGDPDRIATLEQIADTVRVMR